MRRFISLLVLTAYVTAASAATTGRGGIFFGRKDLDDTDWGELDSQAAWGINLDVKDISWPVWATAAYISSRDEITVVTSLSPYATKDIEGKTSELQLGLKKDFVPVPRLRLSVATGPTYARASLDRSAAPFDRDSDSTVGVWAGAEAFLFIGVFVVGGSYQYSHAKVDLLGRSVDAGGKSLALSLGFGW